MELEKARKEIARLEPLIPVAGRLEGAKPSGRSAEELARLRAEVARDEEMVRALDQGGVCPLLTEKCLELETGRIAPFRATWDAPRRGERNRPWPRSTET